MVACTAQEQGLTLGGYYDLAEKKRNPFNLKYFGDHSGEELNEAYQYVVAIGNNDLRFRLAQAIDETVEAQAIIDPTAILRLSTFEKLTVFAPGVIVQPYCHIGKGAIINTGARIDHECQIGAFSHIAPGAVLTGNVHVGDRAFVGAGSVVLPGLTIGVGATLGAGAVLTKHLPAGEIWVGNPAQRINLKP